MENLLILEQAIDSLTNPQINKPSPQILIDALNQSEKDAKKIKSQYNFTNLTGDWQLRFITGTKKTNQNLSKIIGPGFYIPPIFQVKLSYSITDNVPSNPDFQPGIMSNTVQFGLMQLVVSGPAKFIGKNNLLAFDFTQIAVKLLGGVNLYRGNMRGGVASELDFMEKRVANLAFFHYFLIRENFIAARGREGGLALWARLNSL